MKTCIHKWTTWGKMKSIPPGDSRKCLKCGKTEERYYGKN